MNHEHHIGVTAELIRECPDCRECFTSMVEDRHSSAKTRMVGKHRQWLQNIAFYAGRQYVEWDTTLGRLRTVPKSSPSRVRLTLNRIQPLVQDMLARMLKTPPSIVVVPERSGREAEAAVDAARKVLDYIQRKEEWDRKAREMLLWGFLTGVGPVVVEWNPQVGPEVVPPGENGEPPAREGDIGIKVISPFSLYVPADATTAAALPWYIRAERVPLDRLADSYGDEAVEGLSAEDMKDEEEQLQRQIGGQTAGQADVDSTLVLVYTALPTRRYPEGLEAVVAGDRLLDVRPLESVLRRRGRLNLCVYQDIPVPGTFWPASTVEQLIGPQMEYNRTRSQMVENRNLHAHPRVYTFKGSGVTSDQLVAQPGKVYEVNARQLMPVTDWPASAPSDYDRVLALTLGDINDISGIREVSQGQVPGGVRTGRAIAFLQEQDQTRFSVKVWSFEDVVGEVGRLMLWLAKEHYRETRTIRVVGEDARAEAIQLHRDDFGQADDITVQRGSALPQSVSLRQDFVLKLAESGLMDPTDPVERQQILHMMELGALGSVLDEETLDRRNARNELAMFLAGKELRQVHDFDDHAIHVAEHNRFRKSQRYEALNERQKQEIDRHVGLHLDALKHAMLVQQAMAAGAAAPAAPGPAPQPRIPGPNGEAGEDTGFGQMQDVFRDGGVGGMLPS